MKDNFIPCKKGRFVLSDRQGDICQEAQIYSKNIPTRKESIAKVTV